MYGGQKWLKRVLLAESSLVFLPFALVLFSLMKIPPNMDQAMGFIPIA